MSTCMPKPAKFSPFIKQGTLYQKMLTIKFNNVAVDLTGYVFSGSVRQAYGSPVLASFDFVVQDQITNTGQVLMEMLPAQSELLPVIPTPGPMIATQQFIFDVVSVNGGVSVFWFTGYVQLLPAVTL